MLKYTCEGDDLTSRLIDAIIENLVVWVESRGDIVERLVFHSFLYLQFENIEAIIHLEVLPHMLHVQSIELSLGFAQSLLQLGGLQDLCRMVRANSQGLTAIHDILAQSERQAGDTLLRRLIPYRIIVEGAKHATHVRIESVTMILSYHLLQDDRHLLLVDDIAGSSHIRLGITIEHRGIHTLDGTSQHLEHLILVLQIRYHIGGIDAGERLIMSILQERAGTHGDRTLRRLKESEEVGYQRIGQLGMKKVLQNLIIAGIAQGYRIEIVALHKLIEDVGTQDDRLRNLHRGIVILIELRMTLDDIVEECQASALSAQGTFSDTGKVGILVKLHSVEDCHDTQVLHVTILYDGIEDNLSVGIHILQLLPSHVLQECRDREDSTGAKPTAHVVATDMIEHRVVGNREDMILQLLQTADAHDFLVRLWVTEDEVAESHVLLHQLAEIDTHLLGVLIDKSKTFRLCLGSVLALGTL